MRSVRTSLVTGVLAAVMVATLANPAAAAVTTAKSPSLAGYLVKPAGGTYSASVSFYPPKNVACARTTDLQAIAFGLVVNPDGGPELGDVGAFVICDGSTPSVVYGANFADGNRSGALTGVQPTDLLTATAAASGTTLKLAIRDERTGEAVSVKKTYGLVPKVLVGAIGSSTVPSFDRQLFSRAKINGHELGSSSPLTRLFMRHAIDVQVATSQLNAAGKGFAVSFESNT